MKSLDVVPIRRARPRAWHDSDDEITAEVHFLGGLVAGPPVVVGEATSISVVREFLLEQRISAVVVVDHTAPPFGGAAAPGQARVVEGFASLCGIITRTDVLRMPVGIAAEAMSPFILTLPAVSRIERAAALMATENVAHIVVTGHDNELVGLVSAVDIARHYAVLSGFLAE